MQSSPIKSRKGTISQFSIRAIDLRQQAPIPTFITINNVHEFTYIERIREQLATILHVPAETIQLFHPNNPFRSLELKGSQSLHDIKVINGDGFIQYSISSSSPLSFSSSNNHQNHSINHNDNNNYTNNNSQNNNNNSNVNINMNVTGTGNISLNSSNPSKRISISPANVGTSGVYFLESLQDNTRAAVFKPADEEQGMVNNPKGYKNKPLKSFFEPGQGMIREYAAYLLDVDNFSNIPRTQLVRLEDESFRYSGSLFPKTGALQEFVPNGEEICEYGQEMFSDFEIQKIALLDLRLLNCDRNDENVLVIKKKTTESSSSPSPPSYSKTDNFQLIPIDHAYCLPAQLRIECWDWFWFSYPQVKKPICPEIICYFKSINIDLMIEVLCEEVSVSSDCIFLLKLVHHVISKSIDRGLTLYDIASMVARINESIPSPLERMISEAESNTYATLEARSSRNNPHTFGSLSNSYDNAKCLDSLPSDIRNRSYSVDKTESQYPWSSPTRRAIFSSTEKYINAIKSDQHYQGTKVCEFPVFFSPSYDSDSGFTDDASISTFSTDTSQLTDQFQFVVPIRGRSDDSHLMSKFGFGVSGRPLTFTESMDHHSKVNHHQQQHQRDNKSWNFQLGQKHSLSKNCNLMNNNNNDHHGNHHNNDSELRNSNSNNSWIMSLHAAATKCDNDEEGGRSKLIKSTMKYNSTSLLSSSYDQDRNSPSSTDVPDDITNDDRSPGCEDFSRSDSFHITESQSNVIRHFGSGSCRSSSNDSNHESSSISPSSVLRRMVSFTAFPSAPMYDCDSVYEEKLTETLSKRALEPFDIVKGRRVPKKVLQQQVSHDSNEFLNLRQNFAETLVSFLVKKMTVSVKPK